MDTATPTSMATGTPDRHRTIPLLRILKHLLERPREVTFDQVHPVTDRSLRRTTIMIRTSSTVMDMDTHIPVHRVRSMNRVYPLRPPRVPGGNEDDRQPTCWVRVMAAVVAAAAGIDITA